MGERITAVIHGRGRGHAMRALGFVPALRRAGFEVDVWAGGAALETVASLGAVRNVETVAPGPSLLGRIARRTRDDLARLDARRPRVIVSDGDAPSTYAAALRGIPVVAVGHGLTFAYADVGPLPRGLVLREAFNALSSSALSRRQVAVHFADARPRRPTTVLARMDVRPELDRSLALVPEVVAYFRDGGGEDWLRALADHGLRIRLFSDRASPSKGIEVVKPSLRGFADALARASGAVGTAGSNLVAECRYLGIPLLALPADDDVEQRLNARIGARDLRYGPLVEGRLGQVDPDAVRTFVAATRRAERDGRRPDGLPRVSGVDDAVVDAVNRLLAGNAR